jgi:hypothetical protein
MLCLLQQCNGMSLSRDHRCSNHANQAFCTACVSGPDSGYSE